MDTTRQALIVEAYDGSKDPNEFIRQFEVQSFLFDWDGEKLYLIIPKFLKGKTLRLLEEGITATTVTNINTAKKKTR